MEQKPFDKMTAEDLFGIHPEFCARALALTKKKNADYAGMDGKTPFANFEQCSKNYGLDQVDGKVMIFSKMADKMCRLASFLKTGTLLTENESVEDALIDMVNFSVLMYAKMLEDEGWYRDPVQQNIHSSIKQAQASVARNSMTSGLSFIKPYGMDSAQFQEMLSGGIGVVGVTGSTGYTRAISDEEFVRISAPEQIAQALADGQKISFDLIEQHPKANLIQELRRDILDVRSKEEFAKKKYKYFDMQWGGFGETFKYVEMTKEEFEKSNSPWKIYEEVKND